MNHGKIAYLKVIDLEKKLQSQLSNEKSYSGFLELFKENLNYSFTSHSSLTVNFPSFPVIDQNEICFQSKINFISLTSCEVDIELILNNCSIYKETKSLIEGEQDLVIFKSYTPITSEEVTLEIRFTTDDSNANITVESIKTMVMGVSNASLSSDISLRAIATSSQDALISFIDSDKLYYANVKQTATSLSYDDFTYLGRAISHSFSQESYDSSSVILYKVDEQNNLYYSKVFEGQAETLIDTNVSIVHSCTCKAGDSETNLITYIKEGKCFYTTLQNNKIGLTKQFSLPAGKYKDIFALSHPNNDYTYVIASHENGSNYIIRSLLDASTNILYEYLCSDILVTVEKYIDLSFVNNKLTDNLNANYQINIESVLKYAECFDRVSHDSLTADYRLYSNIYKVAPEITYGIFFDRSVRNCTTWASYTDQAEGMVGAYVDTSTGTFIDNGWSSLWPYNQIKPCIIKDNKVVGYLDPNDFSKMEDGSPSNHTDPNTGNVMIEIPKVYYHISKDSNKDITVKISNKPKENFKCLAHVYQGKEYDKIYISAYIASTADHHNKGPVSVSNKQLHRINGRTGYTEGYQLIKSYYGDNWEMMPYNALVLIQCLFTIMFKSSSAQKSIGLGRTKTVETSKTGVLDQKGMFYGLAPTTNTPIKIFGFEDFYNYRGLVCPGLYIDRNLVFKFIDVYDPNSSYDPAYVDSYISDPNATETPSTRASLCGDYMATTEIGFYGANNTLSTSANYYFSSFAYVTIVDDYNYAYFGHNQTQSGGLFNVATTTDIVSSSSTFRLAYYPK